MGRLTKRPSGIYAKYARGLRGTAAEHIASGDQLVVAADKALEDVDRTSAPRSKADCDQMLSRYAVAGLVVGRLACQRESNPKTTKAKDAASAEDHLRGKANAVIACYDRFVGPTGSGSTADDEPKYTNYNPYADL